MARIKDCTTCKWFVPFDHDKGGTCHKVPPTQLNQFELAKFPVIRNPSWCGAYKRS